MRDIDDLDTKIILQLQQDGRRHNVEIARRLGVAEATVRKRIERLIREQVVQIGAWPHPLKVGHQIYAIIEIQAQLADIERVVERLAKYPEIFFLGTCTGSFDIFAAACFRSNDHIYEFMTRRLARLPGIQRTATSSVVRVVKRESPSLIAMAGDVGNGVGRIARRGRERRAAPRRQTARSTASAVRRRDA